VSAVNKRRVVRRSFFPPSTSAVFSTAEHSDDAFCSASTTCNAKIGNRTFSDFGPSSEPQISAVDSPRWMNLRSRKPSSVSQSWIQRMQWGLWYRTSFASGIWLPDRTHRYWTPPISTFCAPWEAVASRWRGACPGTELRSYRTWWCLQIAGAERFLQQINDGRHQQQQQSGPWLQ